MKAYYVTWRESGTNYDKTEGPFETIEQARFAAMANPYPPIPNTLQIYIRDIEPAY